LNLSRDKPDFTAISLYKIFGFPDLGALIVRKSTTAPILDARRYFGGGTVDMVISIDGSWHAKKDDSLHDAHEDGTLPFHNIIALGHALDSIDRIYGGMDAVSRHTALLAAELHDTLKGLKHANSGTPLIELYKDANAQYGNPRTQGATVAFNVKQADGSFVGYQDVEKAADAQRIYVRSGGLCNPGGVALYLGWQPQHMKAAYAYGHRCSKPIQGIGGRATGVVRASLGACSSRKDILALVDFLKMAYLEGSEVEPTGQSVDAVFDGVADKPEEFQAVTESTSSCHPPAPALPANAPRPTATIPRAASFQDSGSQTTTLEVSPDEGSDKAISTSQRISSARRWARSVLVKKTGPQTTVVTVKEVRS
jgi:hypothetical protein